VPVVSRADLEVRATQLRDQGVPFVRARVVLAERPTSAKAGDEAIIHADGSIEGFVGGTCAETTVRAQSLMLLDSKEPLLLRITPTEEQAQHALTADGTLTVHNPCLSGGTLEIFLDPVVPPPLLQVLGDGPIAAALRRLAGELEYRVTPVDPQAIGGALAVVVASHGREEVDVLAAALDADVPYIGLVASRRRGAGVLAELAEARPDLARTAPGRVHSPAGLDIGARSAAEIALSILAEVVATRLHSAAPKDTSADPASPATGSGGRVAGTTTAAIDPVCGMTVAAVESSLHLDHEGERYYFCGPGCLRAFSANPAGFGTSAESHPAARVEELLAATSEDAPSLREQSRSAVV
jgi:xanthine dehydrogenase accessory factor